MKTLVLKNDFHGTSVSLRVNHNGKVETMDCFILSPGQVKKSKLTLCAEGCICSGFCGDRTDWHKLGESEVKLRIEELQDGSADCTIMEIYTT